MDYNLYKVEAPDFNINYVNVGKCLYIYVVITVKM